MSEWSWQKEGWPDLTYDKTALQSDLETIIGKAGFLAGVRSSLNASDQKEDFINRITDETVNSYAIEGETLNRQGMRDSLIASLNARDAQIAIKEVHRTSYPYRNVADVMLDARDGDKPMTLERLNEWHAKLFENDRILNDVGKLRTGPMSIVSYKRMEVAETHFVAPEAKQVPSEMEAFISWLNETGPNGSRAGEFQTPARAALAHLRFETIHPYSDGNGRIGRAIADYVMSQNPIMKDAPFSLSRSIQSDKDAYYKSLEDVSQKAKMTAGGKLDVTDFVRDFSKVIDRAIDQSAEMAIHITRRNTFFREAAGNLNANQEKVLQTLFERGPQRTDEGISNRFYNRTASVSRQTASRDLADLAEKGLVAKSGDGPSTVYKLTSGASSRTLGGEKLVERPDLNSLRKSAEAISNSEWREQALSILDQMENGDAREASARSEDRGLER